MKNVLMQKIIIGIRIFITIFVLCLSVFFLLAFILIN